MTSVDNNGPERGGDDIVAAEYVLGVLPADERTDRDPPHRPRSRLSRAWSTTGKCYFSPMAAAYQPSRAAGLGQAGGRPPAVRAPRATATQPGAGLLVEPWLLARPCRGGGRRASPSMSPCPTSTRRSLVPQDAACRLDRGRRQRRQLSRRLRCGAPARSRCRCVSGEPPPARTSSCGWSRARTRRSRWASSRPAHGHASGRHARAVSRSSRKGAVLAISRRADRRLADRRSRPGRSSPRATCKASDRPQY